MISQHSNENHEDNEMYDIMQQVEVEETPEANSVTFEDTVDNTPDDKSNSSEYADDDDDEILHQASYDFINNTAEPLSTTANVKQISIAHALFRHRHNLSKSCINDLCELLRSLGVVDVPTDFRAIERNMIQNHESVLTGKKYFICSTCGNKGSILSKCENVKCQSYTSFKETPTTLCSFKLLPQITSILERHKLLPEPDDNT